MEKKLIEGTHYYFNEDGLMVFTSVFHIERGYCCGNGCLHCPYNFENVPEPARTYLKTEKGLNTDSKNAGK